MLRDDLVNSALQIVGDLNLSARALEWLDTILYELESTAYWEFLKSDPVSLSLAKDQLLYPLPSDYSKGLIVTNFTDAGTQQVTSYANTGGQGDRTSLITVLPPAGLFWDQSLTNNRFRMVDGVLDVSNTALISTATSWPGHDGTSWVEFEFQTPKIIDEITYKWLAGEGGSTYGTWQWEGSNDQVQYTVLSPTTFTLGGVDTQVHSLAGNVAAFKYYRMRGLSGTVVGSRRWHREVEFKIVDPVVIPVIGTPLDQVSFKTLLEMNSSNVVTSGTPEFFALWAKNGARGLGFYPLYSDLAAKTMQLWYYKNISLMPSNTDVEVTTGIPAKWHGYLRDGLVSEGFKFVDDERQAQARQKWEQDILIMARENDDYNNFKENKVDKESLINRPEARA